MHVFETVILLLLIGAALAALARRIGAPYPALLALAGAAIALMPTVPAVTLDPELALALFVAPVLLLLSYIIAPSPMDLHFTTFELVAIGIAVLSVSFIAHDGETHWMEGVQLLAVYMILALGFFFLPGT